jgi:hypothetical protein
MGGELCEAEAIAEVSVLPLAQPLYNFKDKYGTIP